MSQLLYKWHLLLNFWKFNKARSPDCSEYILISKTVKCSHSVSTTYTNYTAKLQNKQNLCILVEWNIVIALNKNVLEWSWHRL